MIRLCGVRFHPRYFATPQNFDTSTGVKFITVRRASETSRLLGSSSVILGSALDRKPNYPCT